MNDVVHRARITDAAECKAFLLAGNATVTLVSTKTGTRFTYRVRAPDKPGESVGHVSHFVSLLAGPDNESDFQYLGMLINNAKFLPGKKSYVGKDAPSAKAFAWFFDRLMQGALPAAVEVWHEGRCGKCNRKLTVPESIARGIGPECFGRMA